MPPRLELGRIIWAEVADPNGRRKLRPAVIITPTDRISADKPVDVLAVTTRLPHPLPPDYVVLPWHPRGHTRTRLKCRCAVVCTWLARVLPGDIQDVAGIVPGALLVEILSRIVSHSQPPLEAPSGESP